MSDLCEDCGGPATTCDDAGTPLCAVCLAKLTAECEAAPIGSNSRFTYEDGFADALNELVPDLVEDLRWFLEIGGLIERGQILTPRATGRAVKTRAKALLKEIEANL